MLPFLHAHATVVAKGSERYQLPTECSIYYDITALRDRGDKYRHLKFINMPPSIQS